jgi:endonuclease/exonuclease/phosphatase family metal-dependent hydrolase
MRRLKEIQASLGPETGVIVCGDFNSRPDSGSFQVMSSGHIEATHVDWQYGRSFRSEHYASVEPKPDNGTPSAEEDEAATATMVSSAELPPSRGIDVAHGLDIAHVPSSIPELTHATASFRSTLDYIFYSRDVFEATEGAGTGSSIPMLTNAEVDRMGGLPFDHYGSDHVLVAGDIRFK